LGEDLSIFHKTATITNTMLINFQPIEIISKTSDYTITELKVKNPDLQIFEPNQKTAKEWQDLIQNSHEPIILVTPTYWWGMGYEFDHWIQDVLIFNFAYNFVDGKQQGLLNQREFIIYMTHGKSGAKTEVMKKNITQRLEQGIFGYCNATVRIHWVESITKF
jgi:putative NADPH-quinone reductase